MKKFYLFVMMAGLLTTINFSAKAQAFEAGKSYVSVGYGFGNFVQSVFKTYETYDDYSFKMMGPIFGKYEYAINEQIGFGVAFSYVSANVSYTDKSYMVTSSPVVYYEQSIDWSSYSILMRFNWHFNSMGDRLDPYIGFGVGYRGATWTYTDNDPNYDNNASLSTVFPLGMEITAGMRFMVTDYLGVYTEVGLAKAVAQFGVVTKF